MEDADVLFSQLEAADDEDRAIEALQALIAFCKSGWRAARLRGARGIPPGFTSTLARVYGLYSLFTRQLALQLACELARASPGHGALALFADRIGLFDMTRRTNLLLLKLALELLYNIADASPFLSERFGPFFGEIARHPDGGVQGLLFGWLEAAAREDRLDFFEQVPDFFCENNADCQFRFAAAYLELHAADLPAGYADRFAGAYLVNCYCGRLARSCAARAIHLEIDERAVLERLSEQFLPYELRESLILLFYQARNCSAADILEIQQQFYSAKDATLEVLRHLSGVFQVELDFHVSRDAALYATHYSVGSRECVREILLASSNSAAVLRYLELEGDPELEEWLEF